MLSDVEKSWMNWINGFLQGCLGKDHPAVKVMADVKRRNEISY